MGVRAQRDLQIKQPEGVSEEESWWPSERTPEMGGGGVGAQQQYLSGAMISWLERTTKPSVADRLSSPRVGHRDRDPRAGGLSMPVGNGRSGQREKWAMMSPNKTASVGPRGSSEAGMILQGCSKLGHRGHAFRPCTEHTPMRAAPARTCE